MEEHFYPVSEQFTLDMGFYIAAAVTSFDGDHSPIEDPTIATLKFELKTWDISDNEKGEFKFRELKTKMCEESDFNDHAGSNKNSRFLPMSE